MISSKIARKEDSKGVRMDRWMVKVGWIRLDKDGETRMGQFSI
jgi:hypothetical protein